VIKYKWCVCDMDGTLLNSKGIITKENQSALQRLEETGIEVILASGRVGPMMKPFSKQLGLGGHIISCNGGLITNISSGDILYSNIMDKIIVMKIINYCIEHTINFLVYAADYVFSNKNNPLARKYENFNKILSSDLRFPIIYIDDKTIKDINNENILKVLLICNTQEQVELLENVFSRYDNLSVVSSANGLLDIMASNTSKGNALKLLADKLKVNLDSVIAFGDNYNDIEMLDCVGMPIAMGNAVDSLKIKSKYVTKSNDESGIAYAINNLILM
jgi:Cof subfamily protein (haloacid dehalogenase superfamily)